LSATSSPHPRPCLSRALLVDLDGSCRTDPNNALLLENRAALRGAGSSSGGGRLNDIPSGLTYVCADCRLDGAEWKLVILVQFCYFGAPAVCVFGSLLYPIAATIGGDSLFIGCPLPPFMSMCACSGCLHLILLLRALSLAHSARLVLCTDAALHVRGGVDVSRRSPLCFIVVCHGTLSSVALVVVVVVLSVCAWGQRGA
jgi:hypothetical protein